ncbi:4'-phosphopantetheinyl transferase superfamily protein [Luteibacter sp. PPL554]
MSGESDVRRMPLARHPGHPPDAFLMAFDPSSGDDDAFVRHGIACPPSVRRSVAKRRAEYLAGRRVAAAALRDAGSEVGDLMIGPDRAPVWPPAFTGSITHATGLAAAVAMPSRPGWGIGIDLEHVATDSALEAIAQSVVDTSERRALDGLARMLGEATALTVAFSAKESFYKATAATVGRIFDFSALKVVAASDGEGQLTAEVAEPLAVSLPAGLRFTLGFTTIAPSTVITSCLWRPA